MVEFIHFGTKHMSSKEYDLGPCLLPPAVIFSTASSVVNKKPHYELVMIVCRPFFMGSFQYSARAERHFVF